MEALEEKINLLGKLYEFIKKSDMTKAEIENLINNIKLGYEYEKAIKAND